MKWEIPLNRSIRCKNFPQSLKVFFTLVGPHPKSLDRKRGHEISIYWKEFLPTEQKRISKAVSAAHQRFDVFF